MYQRAINLDIFKDESIFVLGARQTEKSTFLVEHFKGVPTFDLLDSELRARLSRRPVLFYEMLQNLPEGSLVIVDEIQKIPDLLDEVHRLMTQKNLRFILCGSSARKLKKSSSNTLGGRAVPVSFYPLVSAEIPDFDIDKAVTNGLIPNHYLATNAWNRLKAYVDIYLKEEIVGEAAVRKLDTFSRFLEAAAIMDGETLNYENIATDCGVSAKTVKEYFHILYDTLVGYEIPAFSKVVQRKLVQAPKFYFFDIGIVNYLTGRKLLKRGTVEYGHSFEHLVVQEIIAWICYNGKSEKMSYWRTYTGIEVDVVLGDARVAIETKSAEETKPRHLKGLKSFSKDYPGAKLVLVSLDRFSHPQDGVECLYILDFFKKLWDGQI